MPELPEGVVEESTRFLGEVKL
jgi:hypothetical protein